MPSGPACLSRTNLIAWNDVAVHVEPKAIEVLLELAKHPGEVVSKTSLLQNVWGGVYICEEVVTNAVSLLRRALRDEARNPCIIQTIPKRGYRLIAPITRESIVRYTPETASVKTAALTSELEGNDLKQSVLRVRHLRHEETPASLTSARAYCEELIRQDCAAAYAELVLTLFLLEKLGAAPREEIEPIVRNAVERAVLLDEGSGMSLVCLAKQEYRYDWKWEKAERHFQTATEADPNNPDVFSEFSLMLSVVRRFDESLRLVERACLLDRMSPAARLQAGHANYASGRWAVAASQYEKLLRFSPQHIFAHWGFADALIRSGKPYEAVSVLMTAMGANGGSAHPLLQTSLFRAKAILAGRGGGQFAPREFPPETNDPVLLAELCISAGDLRRALGLLHQAADVRHYRLSAVNMFPQFAPLREDARYEHLRQRVGLRS
ncbi:MAG: winged helix-turn-helix domain-containing protein [Acidobacteriia bacterium]|nr:winged helix-turn-helix domain-containing protein [Terriglobia bacterium]